MNRVVIKFLAVCFVLGMFQADAFGSEKYDRLLQTYSPIFVQEIGPKPLYDAITRFDFDGNKSGYDNVRNVGVFPLPATVYGEVVAETNDSYFLFYGVYHPRDYDTPLREFFFKSASHDNDFEGLMFAVDKKSGGIVALETWYHSKFLQFAPTPDFGRTQTIDGKLHVDDTTHPLIFVQCRGHGVRALQKIDEELMKQISFKIYRLGQTATDVKTAPTIFIDYTLMTMADFFAFANGPFDAHSMFSAPQDFEIGKRPIGKYLSGNFKGDSSMARPKPPWSWTDKFDTLRPGAWFFHPAFVFGLHFQHPFSKDYLYNLPLEKLLQTDQATLDEWALQPTASYFDDVPKSPFHRPMKALRTFLYNIADYLFYYLG